MASTINATGSGIVLTGSTSAALNLLVGGSAALSIGTGATTTISNATITSLTISNPSTFPAGSASAPAITTTGDTNTGVYFPAADQVAVTTGGTVAAAFNTNGLFFRNRVINGDMRIAQRGTDAITVNDADNARYAVDRFYGIGTPAAGVFTVQQSTTAPTGFVNSFIATVTTTSTPSGTNNYGITHIIEGTNIADLGWGAAGALPVTISFWVRSSVTGTFGGSLRNSAANRSYPFTYSISAANTWEYKSVTIPGDTTGTWLTTTGRGILFQFNLGAGSDRKGAANTWAAANYSSATGAIDWISNSSATFYVTGFQLETGSVATPFERRPYGTELMLCQRYYYRLTPGVVIGLLGAGYVVTTTQAVGQTNFPVPMRTRPTALEQSGTANQYEISHANTTTTCSSVPTYQGATTANSANTFFTVSSGLTVGQGCYLRTDTTNGATAYLGWSAEL